MKNLSNLKFLSLLLLVLLLIIGCNQTEGPTIPEEKQDQTPNALFKKSNCIAAPYDLVSWWPGDGDEIDIISGNNGFPRKGTSYADGMVDKAFCFDGVNDYIQILDNNSLDLPGALTIDAWVNIRASDHYNIVLAKRDEANNRNYQLTINPGGTVRFENSNGERDTDDTLTPGLWYHLAATHDGIETVNIYINGALSKTCTLPPAPVNDNLLKIGHDCCNFMEGLIDEVEIYNRALAANEICAIYNAGAAGKCKPESYLEVPILNSANGHYYAAFSAPAGITWDNALREAFTRKFRNLQGYLAVVTSQEENDFIVDNFPKAFPWGRGGFWLGGLKQQPSTTPDEGWAWITGEPWGFTKWGNGEPNDELGEEEVLHFNWWDSSQPKGSWNDIARSALILGYVVEYEHQVKVTICHKPGTPAQKTLVIPIEALDGHLDHGDRIGSCQ